MERSSKPDASYVYCDMLRGVNTADLIPTRASLRKLLRKILLSDSELNSFVVDHFPRVAQGFASGMDRATKENLLLQFATPESIWKCLQKVEPQGCQENAHMLEATEDAPPGSRSEPLPHPYEGVNFARNLDRIPQWETVVKHCEGNRNTVYLLHGAKKHNLSFFLDRLVADLQAKTGVPHRLIFVPFRLGVKKALCAGDWEKHLYVAMHDAISQRKDCQHLLAPTAEQMLALITRETPLFIMLGNRRPLEFPKDKKIELHGVIDFVRNKLATLLRRRQSWAARLLIPIEYDTYTEAIIGPLRTAVMSLETTDVDIQCVEIDSPKVPDWEEILDFLRRIKRVDRYTKEEFSVSEEELEDCFARYQRLKRSGFTFQQLVEELKAVIEP